MNQSFDIYSYKKRVTQEEEERQLIVKTKSEKSIFHVEDKISTVIAFIYLAIAGAVIWLIPMRFGQKFFAFIGAFLFLWFVKYLTTEDLLIEEEKAEKIYSPQKIHFLSDKIEIETDIKKQDGHFLYTNIQKIEFIYKGVHAYAYFHVHIENEVHIFKIWIDSDFHRKKMIAFFTTLYERNIPFKEYNKDNEELHLLQKIALPENKPEKKIEIDENIQRLIDEIGENN